VVGVVAVVTPVHAGLLDELRETVEKTRRVLESAGEIGEKVEDLGKKDSDQARYDRAWIRELQRRLEMMGFQPGPVDGVYGDKTAQAIRAFQASRGMAVSGEPTPAVMHAARSQTPFLAAGSGGGEDRGPPASALRAALEGHPAPRQERDLSAYREAPALTEHTPFEYLLKRYVQANPDIVAHAEFVRGFANRLCHPNLEEIEENEVTLHNHLQEVRAKARQYAERALNMPAGPVSIDRTSRLRLGQYDFDRGGFPIHGVNKMTIYRGDDYCDVLADDRTYPETFVPGDLEGERLRRRFEEALALLPMGAEEAEQFIARNERARNVELRMRLAVGKFTPEHESKRFQSPVFNAVVTSARAYHMETGELLHEFDPQAFLPEPDTASKAHSKELQYGRLLEAYMATYPEVKDKRGFALPYLSYLPANEECPAELELLEGDEFDRQRFWSEVWPQWQAGFAEEVASARPLEVERLYSVYLPDVELGRYDFETRSFSAELPRWIHVESRDSWSPEVTDRRFCVHFSSSAMPTRFQVPLINRRVLTGVPMAPGAAEAFSERDPERKVDMILYLAMGEPHYVEGSSRTSLIEAALRTAAVYDPGTGELLHDFGPDAFTPPEDRWDDYRYPRGVELLLAAVRRNPELIEQDDYVEAYIAREDCRLIRNTRDNEIERGRLVEQWRPRLREAAAAGEPALPEVVRVSVDQRVETYDESRGMFPFGRYGGLRRSQATRFRAAGDYCAGGPNIPLAFFVAPPVELLNKGLPVSKEAASKLLEKMGGPRPEVRLELLVQLSVADGGVGSDAPEFTGEVIGARARQTTYEVPVGPIIHEYELGGGSTQQAGGFGTAPAVTYEALMRRYLARHPEYKKDRTFVHNYASTLHCEALRETRDNEIKRQLLLDELQQKLTEEAAPAGNDSPAQYNLTIGARLGSYDREAQGFPVQVGVVNPKGRKYGDIFSGPVTAYEVENPDDRQCAGERVDQPLYPLSFIVTLENRAALNGSMLSMPMEEAMAFLDREELAPGRENKEINIEMVVRVEEPGLAGPAESHDDFGISVLRGVAVAARVVDPANESILQELDVAAGAARGEKGALAGLPEGLVPEGAEWIAVQAGEGEVESYALARGFDFGRRRELDGEVLVMNARPANLVKYLRRGDVALVMTPEQLAGVYDEVQHLELTVSDVSAASSPAQDEPASAASEAAAAALQSQGGSPDRTPTARPDLSGDGAGAGSTATPGSPGYETASSDQRPASEFVILGAKVGMAKPELLQVLRQEFQADEIRPQGDQIAGVRGLCLEGDKGKASLDKLDSLCLVASLGANGRVDRLVLRQILPGNKLEPALEAYSNRYGTPLFVEEQSYAGAGRRMIVGWGRELGIPRSNTGRPRAAEAPTVLEAEIVSTAQLTIATLRLDSVVSESKQQGEEEAEIKF